MSTTRMRRNYSGADVDPVIFIRRRVESEIIHKTQRRGDAEMKYLLLIYHEENQWAVLSEPERQKMYVEYAQLIHHLTTSGQSIRVPPLTPLATPVRRTLPA